jgi:hypothetical protein
VHLVSEPTPPGLDERTRYAIRDAIAEHVDNHWAPSPDDIDAATASVMQALADTPRLLTAAGHYYSTHCLHEHHDQCKGECKHCTTPCRCHDASSVDNAPLNVDIR